MNKRTRASSSTIRIETIILEYLQLLFCSVLEHRPAQQGLRLVGAILDVHTM